MTPTPKRAEPTSTDPAEPLELTSADLAPDYSMEEERWLQPTEEVSVDPGAGGRQVLGIALVVLSVVWLSYSAWSAGRTLAGQPLTSPIVAQWVAVAAAPLALFALLWLIFGRTRRKESERFTRSVVAMRSEAQTLEALLEVLSQRINDSRSELTMMAQHLMQLGDDASGKLSGITQQFDSSSEKLKRHGEVLDRAAESARNDVAVLLEDLPRAEETTRALAEHLRALGSELVEKAEVFSRHVGHLTERTREADQLIAQATDRLATRLAEIDIAGMTASARLGEADAGMSSTSGGAARTDLRHARRDPKRNRRSVVRRCRIGRAGLRRAWPRRNGRRRITRGKRRPRQQLSRKPVRASRRAGSRLAVDDRRDRPRPRDDR